MTLSSLPLGYCTNVHPGRSLNEVIAGLDQYAVAVQARLNRPLAVGLWLSAPVISELRSLPDGHSLLRDALAARGLVCYTLNAFPYGDFHGTRVKEQVYLPDWSTPERLEYTAHCAEALAELLQPGTEGSISTLPLGFKPAPVSADFERICIDRLMELAVRLADLRARTGRTIRLAIEPEPFCRIETTPEAIAFFRSMWSKAATAGCEAAVREHLGLCYDVCHQAVEFEEAGDAIRSIEAAGIRIVKVQLSCAIELRDPLSRPEAREALAQFVEPRYLHQTMARCADGRIARAVDLTHALAVSPSGEFSEAPLWRIHFHVPVDAERIGPLGTTREELKRALHAIAGLSTAPHLEVETYTWEVLPGQTPDLVDGLRRELEATIRLMETLRDGNASSGGPPGREFPRDMRS